MKVLSLGAGVQSSTVLLMSCRGVLPKLDAAIFADTQWEPAAVYRWLDDVLEPEAQKAGIPLYRVTAGNIREDAMRSRMRADEYKQIEGGRWASMPLYTQLIDQASEGQIRRQCTKEYKIEPVKRKARELRGDSKVRVSMWMGISAEEKRRMRISQVHWIEHYYPLIFGLDRPWHRHDCQRWIKGQGFPLAPRSACIGCPYRSNEEWRALVPDEFSDAVLFDRQIRSIGGLTADTYLHRSCKPLIDVDLRTLEEKGQGNWLNECEGMCGV